MPPKSTPSFRRRLLAWFASHGRELPWRNTRNPYRILVSEFMLQQTQVSRVTEYYPRFLRAFPTVHRLAAARPAQVREAWQGLGYYRRAANLHRLAREVSRKHAGELPADPAELARLPGVGRYTATAVGSFAFERPVATVDTNISRVIRRAFHPRLPKGARGERQVWETAAAILPRHGKTAWRFNQALMELGALVCTARQAFCERCPVAVACLTGKGRQGAPNKNKRVVSA